MKRIFLACLLIGISLLEGCGGGGSSSASISVGPTALQAIDTVVGTGATATSGSTVTVNYTGWLYDAAASNFHGAQFDSSIGRAPFSFKLGASQVIAGWDQGVAGMKVGGSRTLIIPSAMAYGSSGAGSAIPPNAALVFNVDLLAVQ